MKNVPNILTSLRLLGSIVLIFIPPVTPIFFVVYTVCGVTDVFDGMIARKTNSASTFGAKLDSIADLSFYSVMLIRLCPLLTHLIPAWMWYSAAVVLTVRLGAYLVSAFKFRRFASLHSLLNKLTGFLVFIIPYLMYWKYFLWYCLFLGAIAFVASLQELIHHIRSSHYIPGKNELPCQDIPTKE